MTAHRECLLEAARLLEAEDCTCSTLDMAGLLRSRARGAPPLKERPAAAERDGMAVLEEPAENPVQVELARAAADAGAGPAPAPRLEAAAAAVDRSLEALERAVVITAVAGPPENIVRKAAGIAPAEFSTCRGCRGGLTVHIDGLCLGCWRAAGSPDGVLETVPPLQPQEIGPTCPGCGARSRHRVVFVGGKASEPRPWCTSCKREVGR